MVKGIHQNIGRTLDSHIEALDQIDHKVEVNSALLKKNTRDLKEMIN